MGFFILWSPVNTYVSLLGWKKLLNHSLNSPVVANLYRYIHFFFRCNIRVIQKLKVSRISSYIINIIENRRGNQNHNT